MRPTDLAPAAGRRCENPGAGHVIEAGTHSRERLADNAQALPGLLVDVASAHGGAVIGGWRTAADLDRRTYPHRACVADDTLPLAPGGVGPSRHAGTGEVQNAQRRAPTGIKLRHSGHLRVVGSGGGSRRDRAISLFTGTTTKKKT